MPYDNRRIFGYPCVEAGRMRVCAESGCPTLTDSTRCAQHTTARETARGNRHARGYGSDHNKLRAKWAPLVDTGLVQCWRCHLLIPAGSAWDLGHDDHDRTRYRGPEHRACNRATSGRTERR